MNKSNSWYIEMHLDRLNEELIAGYGKKVDEPQKKKQQENNTDVNNKD